MPRETAKEEEGLDKFDNARLGLGWWPERIKDFGVGTDLGGHVPGTRSRMTPDADTPIMAAGITSQQAVRLAARLRELNLFNTRLGKRGAAALAGALLLDGRLGRELARERGLHRL